MCGIYLIKLHISTLNLHSEPLIWRHFSCQSIHSFTVNKSGNEELRDSYESSRDTLQQEKHLGSKWGVFLNSILKSFFDNLKFYTFEFECKLRLTRAEEGSIHSLIYCAAICIHIKFQSALNWICCTDGNMSCAVNIFHTWKDRMTWNKNNHSLWRAFNISLNFMLSHMIADFFIFC